MLRVKDLKHKMLYLDDTTKRLLARLKEDRTRLCMTQRELAERIGIPKYLLAWYEQGRHRPNVYTFMCLGGILLDWDISRNINCIFARVFVNKRVKKDVLNALNAELLR